MDYLPSDLARWLQEAPSELISAELTFIIMMAVAAVVAILTRYVRLLSRVPYTVALVVVGLLASLVRLPVSIPISSDLILALLVPPLLFEATLHLKWEKLKLNLTPILLLALVGTLISTFVVAFSLTWATFVQIPLAAAIAFGALISATDPVAVIAFFRTLGVSKRLAVLVEGESLFNDGVAIVLFSLAVAAGEAMEAGTWQGFNLFEALLDFVIVAGGGTLVGVVLGAFVSYIVLRNVDDHLIETVTTLTLAFGAYLTAEEFGFLIGQPSLHLSGILAVVAAGLFVGNIGRENTSPTTGLALDSFWEFLAFVVNSLVFLVIGLTIDITRFAGNLGAILLAVVLVLVSRFFVVRILAAIHAAVEPNRRIGRRYQMIMWWGGLRGAISLALALTLTNGPFRAVATDLQLMTFGVVLFTLLFQGMTIERLILNLGLAYKAPAILAQQRLQAQIYASSAGQLELDRLYQEGIVAREIYDAMSQTYASEIAGRKRSFLHHLRAFPELEQNMVMQARTDLLRAERNALGSALRRGLISEEIYEELVRELDDRTAALEIVRASQLPDSGGTG